MSYAKSFAALCFAAAVLAVLFASLPLRAAEPPAAADKLAELPLLDKASEFGITWTFDKKVPVGQFVNGDYYVVGPVQITAIDPKPEMGEAAAGNLPQIRNGSVLNLPPSGLSAFDDRVEENPKTWVKPELAARLPLALKPGDSLVSSISVDKIRSIPVMLRPKDKSGSPIRTVAVLTCLEKQVPADAFRPGYCDRAQQIYLARNLKRDLLPQVPRVKDTPPLAEYERYFQRPWIDTALFGYIAPLENMPAYGREMGRMTGMGALLLCCDFTPEEKEKLLVNYVQVGIDLFGIVKAGGGDWRAFGGHHSGRKMPIIVAGMLLGDAGMQSPYKVNPKVRFQEDEQTLRGKGWTGTTALYAGHTGRDSGGSWGLYENRHPSRWWNDAMSESYRRSCTSLCWVAEALALHMMHGEKVWDHDVFFDYVDRWMSPEDPAQIDEIIKYLPQVAGWIKQDWASQGQAWDDFTNEMWAKYRNNLPPEKK